MGNEAKKGDASSMAAQWNTRLWMVPCVLSLLACLTAISLPMHMFARSRELSPLNASNEAIMFVAIVSAFYILHRLAQALLLLYKAFVASNDDLKNEKFIQRLSVLLCLSEVRAGGNGSRQVSLRPEWSNRCDWSGSIYSESEIRIQLSIRLFSSCDPLRVALGTEQNLGRH